MQKTIKFKNGLEIPRIGFGTWQILGDECVKSVSTALGLGFRHIDTADRYNNHREVGKGIKESGVKREDFFLTTKVWRDDLQHDELISAANRFLDELQTDYLDLLLIHWPNTEIPITESLSALEELRQKGSIKSLGVSNFTVSLLKEAVGTGIKFVNNQIEYHPSLQQKEIKEFCDENNIVVTAYSPIAQAQDLALPVVKNLAEKYSKSPSQIILNWLLKKDIVVIPRTTKKERMEESLHALDFEISDEDSAQIDSLNLHNRLINPSFAPFGE